MMYGNMSKQEKQLNKEDLIAYKRFDNKNYAMIPGISNQKNVLDQSLKKSPKVVGKEEKLK